MRQINHRFYISLLFILIGLSAFSQADTEKSYVGLGFHLGYVNSNMRFILAEKEKAPDYSNIQGYSGGFIANLMAEKYAGVQIEVNFANRGWQESLDSTYTYKRSMRYLEIPILTHISLGKKRFRYVFNLGPYMAFHRKTTETYEILNTNLAGANGDSISSLGLPIDSKFDLGFIFDVGFGVNTSVGIFQIKARYSQGVINVFNKYPESIYRYSQMRNVYFGVSYYYNFYFKKDS